jgi:hypothetical protein
MIGTPVGRPRPRRRWIWIIVAIVTTLAVVLPAGLRFWLKADMQHRSDPAVSYRRPITALLVNAPGGNVIVRPGRVRRVRVASSLTWVLGRPVVSQTWRGKALRISVRCTRPDLFEDCAASLDLTVPAGVVVRADVGSGNVSVSGLAGSLHLAATSGSITLGQVTGSVWATATTGSISGRRLSSARLHASVSSGAMALTFSTAPSLLSLAVGSGSADVTVPPGTSYRIVRARGPGLLEFQPSLDDPDAARLLTANAGSGTISVK